MRRRTFLGVIGALAVTPPPKDLCAQPSRKVWRIGVLESAPEELNAANLDAFRMGMQELGYVERRDYVLVYRFLAEGSAEQHQETAAELTAAGVDVILTRGSPAVAAAQSITSVIPIVMAANAEPIGLGIVDSLARPRGNVTGLSAFTIELVPKQLELLREIVPNVRKIAVFTNMGSSVGMARWEAIRAAGGTLGIESKLHDVRRPEDLRPAFAAATEAQSEALIFGLDHVIRGSLHIVVDLAAAHRLPAVYGSREFVAAGGLISYGARFPQLYFRAASFVDKLLKGAKPTDIPVEQPTAVELALNLNTAQALGLSISPTLLARADEVIE
jgi:putative ABC transport system substrate-binding protein